jgi:hypothetical protein
MLQGIPLFPTPVWRYSIPNWEEKKTKLLSLHEDKPEYWQEDSFTDFFRGSENDYREEFSTIISQELSEFEGAVKKTFPGTTGLTLGSVWTQKYLRHNFMPPHTHGPRGFSAVVYTEFVKGEHKSTCLQSYSHCPISGRHQHVELSVEEGDMIIFPSTMPHYVNPCKSDKQRTIISFNLYVDWIKQ